MARLLVILLSRLLSVYMLFIVSFIKCRFINAPLLYYVYDNLLAVSMVNVTFLLWSPVDIVPSAILRWAAAIKSVAVFSGIVLEAFHDSNIWTMCLRS